MEEVAGLLRAGHEVQVQAAVCDFAGLHDKNITMGIFDHVVYAAPHFGARDRLDKAARLLGQVALRPGFVARYRRNLLAGRSYPELFRTALRATTAGGLTTLFDRALGLGNLSLALDQQAKATSEFVPDVIHCPFLFEWECGRLAALLERNPGTPFTVSLRALDLYLFARRDELRARRIEALRSAAKLITIARVNRDYIATSEHLDTLAPALRDPAQVPIVHSGIDPRFFAPDPRIAKRPRQIAAVARVVPMKGLHFLVLACAILRERGVDVRCVIVGEGSARPALEALIKGRGLEAHIELRPIATQHEVRQVLAESEVFALPCVVLANGDRDILPNSVKEAMAMELPVVTSDISGIDELVSDGVSGLLVPPSAPLALADRIAELLADHTLRERLGKAARAVVLEHFDSERESSKLATILEHVVARHGSARA